MSRSDPQFNLRIPAELKRRIEDAAQQNKRSATAEIIARLEATFDFDALMTKRTHGDQNHTYLPTWLAHLESREEILDAMDMGNPMSLKQLELMIEGAVSRALAAAATN